MTANSLTTMFLGEKKNRASKTALPNLSFSRVVRLPSSIILLCDRVGRNSIKPVSHGKVTGQKPCIYAGLGDLVFSCHRVATLSLLSSQK
jgi:hypothetical protein